MVRIASTGFCQLDSASGLQFCSYRMISGLELSILESIWFPDECLRIVTEEKLNWVHLEINTFFVSFLMHNCVRW